MLFFFKVSWETFVCLIIMEKHCSLVFKTMNFGASLPGSNSICAIYYLCDFWHVF